MGKKYPRLCTACACNLCCVLLCFPHQPAINQFAQKNFKYHLFSCVWWLLVFLFVCLFCFVLFCFTFLCRIEFFQQIFPANTKSQKNQIKSNGKEGQNTSVTSSDKRVVSVTDFITVLSLVFPNYLYEEKKCILHVLLLLLHQ